MNKPTPMMPVTEAVARAARDEVYEQRSSNENWAACRDAWMQRPEVEWLAKQLVRVPRA